ncbi:hypothetical protein [Radicibacter daui]|uniref:hypothetical protein n=1 Tax=Radicibacter daui TaxID=3064829 RepID=UPI0040468CE3
MDWTKYYWNSVASTPNVRAEIVLAEGKLDVNESKMEDSESIKLYKNLVSEAMKRGLSEV